MQSSFGLAMRAVVMLACLAAVPLVALYGKRLPKLYQAVVDAYHSHAQGDSADDLRETGAGGPSALAGLRYGGAALPGDGAAPFPWPNQGPAPLPLANWRPDGGGSTAAEQPGAQRASFDAPVGGARSGGDQSPAGPRAGASAGQAPGAADSCTTQFRRAEHRLRELGATYYLLENWGDRYRFLCHVAIAGAADSSLYRIFQATADDPLTAMQHVLDEVEKWRAGG